MSEKTNIDIHNVISPVEMHDIITTCTKELMNNPGSAKAVGALLVRGAPGCGKSSIVKQVANELGIGFIDIRLAQLERCDVSGLPSLSDNKTVWNVPDFWPRDPESAGIIMFDEITSAPRDVQVAAYSIILDRRIPNSNYELPPKWMIVAAGNRTTDRAVAQTMSSALANRFAHFELENDMESWIDFAVQHNFHPSVTGFIRYRPALLFKMEGQNLEMGWPSPRSWERVSNAIPLFNESEDVLRKVIYGLVGNGAGVEFVEFHRTAKNFDNVLEYLTDPKKEINIPKEASEKYAMTSAVSYLLWQNPSEEECKKRVEGLYRIAMKLTADFATMLIKSACLGNDKVNRIKAIQYITHSESYPAFRDKFGNNFTKTYKI